MTDQNTAILNDISFRLARIESQTRPKLPWLVALPVALALNVFAVPYLKASDYAYIQPIMQWISDKESKGIALLVQLMPKPTQNPYAKMSDTQRQTFAINPLRNKGWQSSGFGYRQHPILKKRKFHAGLDYAAPAGTPIHATASGTVCFVGWKGGYGKLIELCHPQNVTTRYGHMRAFRRNLKKGDRVAKWDVIGYVGSTGRSTGNHVHYEWRVAGKAKDPLQANKIMMALNVKRPSTQQVKTECTPRLTPENQQRLLVELKRTESSGGNYQIVNSSNGSLGAYQTKASTLSNANIGLIKAARFNGASKAVRKGLGFAHKSFLNNSDNWTLKGGKQAFLGSRELQDKVALKTLENHLKWGKNYGAISCSDSQKKLAGYAKASWFGWKNAARWYRDSIDFEDGNDYKVSQYAREGEAIAIEQPIKETITGVIKQWTM